MSLQDQVGGWLIDAVESGDPRKSLLAQRRKLAQVLELTMNRDAATLAKGIQEIDRLLDGLAPDVEVSELDELRERRERHWSTSGKPVPGRRPDARRDRRSGGKAGGSAS
jgi:hypothetical protein